MKFLGHVGSFINTMGELGAQLQEVTDDHHYTMPVQVYQKP